MGPPRDQPPPPSPLPLSSLLRALVEAVEGTLAEENQEEDVKLRWRHLEQSQNLPVHCSARWWWGEELGGEHLLAWIHSTAVSMGGVTCVPAAGKDAGVKEALQRGADGVQQHQPEGVHGDAQVAQHPVHQGGPPLQRTVHVGGVEWGKSAQGKAEPPRGTAQCNAKVEHQTTR